MECLLKSPMKLVLLVAWLSILLGPGKFSEVCKKCHKDAKCENKNGSEKCLCNLGYTGDGIKFCADDDECQNVTDICGKNANCTNTLGSYFCTCNPGFKSTGLSSFQTNDGTLCEDIDECKNEKVCGPFSHCHNTNGSYYCSCQRGYDPVSETKPKDGRFCIESPKKNCHLNDTCISKIVNKTIGSMTNITKPLPLLEEIRKQTSGELSPVDVISYVEALSHSVTLLNPVDDTSTNMEALANETITEFISTVNNLVEKDEMNAWYKIKTEDRERTITKLLHTVEEATLSISKNYKTSTEVEVNREHIALKLYAFDSEQTKTINIQTTVKEDFIKLTSKKTNLKGNVSIVFLHYNGISNLLKHSNDRPVMDYEQFAEDFTVASQVIAVALKPANIYKVEHITFSLKHSQPVDSEAHVTKCAFWEYSPPIMKGRWATTGCERSHANRSHTTCSCNHLTHFAILMSSGRADLSPHVDILTRITQLGMIISLICLSMCIFTFWFFSEIQSTRTTIHKNLCCSLFMGEFIFLVGIKMSAHKLFCSIVAMLLHYFFLAAFAWMCIEGIHLYLIVAGVIYNKGFLHRNFYIFGYGSPAVVVIISATLGYKYYGTNKACWLSTENNFIWSFIGPACLIILVNLLAFGVIIYKVYRHTAIKKPEISHYENIRSCARGALALLFVLGATWTFGILHILHETTATAYLFTIFNVFQGMFIFIFLCVLSRKIQEEYYRLFKNVPCCFECLR
ncbi:adhesion G protein-coupled receptor L4 isoform X1 [Scleropages formosus]|uniref:adhesion G protein-coupled receptor L4 isoform X1 n=1 Tax=Scleropages formosus TaxID=113540 RepID=UPI000878D333|nr:adhesion G protein-coupled receptor L4 isoform X1 [Scleropages formosus]